MEDSTLADTGNYLGVGMRGDDIVVLLPRQVMSAEQALVHAAWLVALADPSSEEFGPILEAVRST